MHVHTTHQIPEQLELFDSAPVKPPPARTIFDGYIELLLRILAQREPHRAALRHPDEGEHQ
jgi:hypothetical protein